MIHYRDLTDEEKAIICNGCGPKARFLTVPEFFLHEICDHHDFNYWIGCTWRDRLRADNQLLAAAWKIAGGDPVKRFVALTYYVFVRLFGAFCFHYATRERDEKDLVAEVNRIKRDLCHAKKVLI